MEKQNPDNIVYHPTMKSIDRIFKPYQGTKFTAFNVSFTKISDEKFTFTNSCWTMSHSMLDLTGYTPESCMEEVNTTRRVPFFRPQSDTRDPPDACIGALETLYQMVCIGDLQHKTEAELMAMAERNR